LAVRLFEMAYGEGKSITLPGLYLLFNSHGYWVSWWLGRKPPYRCGGIGPMTWERWRR